MQIATLVRWSTHRAVRLGFLIVPLWLGVVPALASSTESKTHVLFMGADVAVERDKAFHPVEDVTGTALLITRDGKRVKVPMEKDVNLQIRESLKIADTSVVIDDLKTERAYAPGSDPFEQLHRAATFGAGESAVADLARGDVITASINAIGAGSAMSSATSPQDVAQAAAGFGRAMAAQQAADTSMLQAYERPIAPVYDVGTQAGRAGVETSYQLFDAIRLSFEITSDRDMEEPYYAVLAMILTPDSKPGHARKWAYLKSLGSLKAGERRKVQLYQSGLPPGYTLESCEVHVYDRGEELATSLSRKRVELTDEEALDYRIIEYVGANKGLTLPARPVLVPMTPAERLAFTPAQLSEKCYVRVARDGRVTAAFRDAAGKRPLADPELEAALKRCRFNPALEAGKPVESLVAIKLAPD
jgi:hypothetical protein